MTIEESDDVDEEIAEIEKEDEIDSNKKEVSSKNKKNQVETKTNNEKDPPTPEHPLFGQNSKNKSK